jgi:putative MATE family efflux protein
MRRTPGTDTRIKKIDLTEGNILKNIFRMGIPSAIGFFSVNLYDFIDALWVAKLGASHVAAITIFFGFYWVISSLNQLAGTGSVSVISQNYGNKDYDRTEAAIKETYLLKWGIAIFFGTLGLIFLEDVMRLLGASTESIGENGDSVLSLAIDYGTIQILGLGFSMSAFTNYTALRGVGNPKMAMWLMIASVCFNIILDPFLIFGWWIFPSMGIKGAALASVISHILAFFGGLFIFYGGFANIKLNLKGKLPVRLKTILKIIRIGAPSGLNSVSFSLSRSIILAFVAMTTTEAVAAYGIGNKISALSIMIIVGLGLGLAALIGQLLGAEKPERARKTAYQAMAIALVTATSMALLTIVFAEQIMRIFFDPSTSASEAAVVAIGVKMLRIISISLPFVGIYIIMEMTFTGAGNNVPPMVFGVITGWVLEIPLIYGALKILDAGPVGIWWALTISSIIGISACFWWFRKGNWINVRVKGD